MTSSPVVLPALPFPLAPEGPDATWSAVDGALRGTAPARSDLFVDPARAPGDDAPLPDASRLLGTPPAGDFTLSARVSVRFAATFDAGVLLVHAGDTAWAKLCFEYTPQGSPSVVSVVTRGFSDDANAFLVDADDVRLRVARAGRAWALHASTDGTWWHLVRYFSLGADADAAARVGFLVQSPTGDGCSVAFDEIAFTTSAPADLRDGS